MMIEDTAKRKRDSLNLPAEILLNPISLDSSDYVFKIQLGDPTTYFAKPINRNQFNNCANTTKTIQIQEIC